MRTACLIASLSFAAAACDSQTTAFISAGSTTTGANIVIASAPSVAVFTSCIAPATVHPAVNLVVAAPRSNVTLDNVTMRLLDGTNVGGSPITVPRAGLQSTFGTTVVLRGTTRSFLFHPAFGCPHVAPRAIRADVTLLDEAGMPQTMSGTAPLQ
jgi:hypothetical protein